MGKSGPRFWAMFWAGGRRRRVGPQPSPPPQPAPPQSPYLRPLAGGPDVRLRRPSSPPLVHPLVVGEHLFNPLIRVEVFGIDRSLATGGAAVAAAAVVLAEGGYVVSATGPAA